MHFLSCSVNYMGTELTLSVPAHIMASVFSALSLLCSAESAWQHHLPPVHTEHPSAQSSAVRYLCKEEIKHYVMLNYKISLSIFCKGGEGIQIAKKNYRRNNTEFIKFDFKKKKKVHKNFKNFQENIMGQTAFVPLR